MGLGAGALLNFKMSESYWVGRATLVKPVYTIIVYSVQRACQSNPSKQISLPAISPHVSRTGKPAGYFSFLRICKKMGCELKTTKPVLPTIDLRAGPLALRFHDGDLRTIVWNGRECVRRIYAAVRDRNWETAPNLLSDVEVRQDLDGFEIRYTCENLLYDVDFAWRCEILGTASGRVTLSMDGVARKAFLKNRIGFCVLHPASCAGARCDVHHTDGTVSTSVLPQRIAASQPVPPFLNMRGLSQQLSPTCWLEMQFTGDEFEMEDQRNWTDASFKTFGTPLGLPAPVELVKGQRVAQKIELRLRQDGPAATPVPRMLATRAGAQDNSAIRVSIGTRNLPMPRIGVGLGNPTLRNRSHAWQSLRELKLAHVRSDVHIADAEFAQGLRSAIATSTRLCAPLELALFVPTAQIDASLRSFGAVVRTFKPNVARWILYREREIMAEPPLRNLLASAREHLEHLTPEAEFAAGVDTDYMFINRYPAAARRLSALAVAINPQVHAFDDTSLIETLEAQGTLIANARALAHAPVIISPVTLRPRHNPYATKPAVVAEPPVDPRQRTWFGAAWTLGSIKHLAEHGVTSVTYYELLGDRGLGDAHGMFPVADVFAALAEHARASVVCSRSAQPLRVESLVLRFGLRTCALLANFGTRSQPVVLRGVGGPARVSLLGESTNGNRVQPVNESLGLTLAPQSITRVGWHN